MRKMVSSIFLTLFSLSIAAAPSMQSTAVAVSPGQESAVLAAMDKWMDGYGSKSKSRVILQSHVADGGNPATHSFVVINPSMAAGESFNEQVSSSDEGMADWQAFLEAVTPVSRIVGTARSAVIRSWGDIDNDNDVWLVHSMSTGDAASVVRAMESWMNSPTGKKFPGEAHLIATVAAGPNAGSHLVALGYESQAEMEKWGDTSRPSGDLARLLHSLSVITDYHGANMAITVGSWGKSAKDVLK